MLATRTTTRRFALPLLVAGLIACGGVLAGCDGEASVSVGERTVDVKEIEEEGAAKLIEAADQPEGSATLDCPGKEVEAKKGETLDCTLNVDDGSTLDVLVTMTDDEGAFDVEVADAVNEPADEG
jgi:hypothetical protein